MKKVAFLCALLVLGVWAFASAAGDVQTVNIAISKLNKNYAFKTDWGNIYFGEKDLHRLIHGAARLRPTPLGDFLTDQGSTVAVKTLGYDKGIVTMAVSKGGSFPIIKIKKAPKVEPADQKEPEKKADEKKEPEKKDK